MASDSRDESGTRLILPFMGPFYRCFAEPVGWALFRLLIGGALVIEGWPKIMAPMAQVGFVEGIGFYPGWLFSPLLAVMQVVGGAMMAVGLLTRPVALANAVMLAITLWFHVSHPYGAAFLNDAGRALLGADPTTYLTPQGKVRLLADGGASFLAIVQSKAEYASLFWTAGAFLLAAFGGGPFSVDRAVLKREF